MAHDQPLLLVDNNERDADLLKLMLESDGFMVDTAYCGWAAVEKVKGRRYASVILDFALPDMKGDELAERIRLENPEMGVILLTGFRPARVGVHPDATYALPDRACAPASGCQANYEIRGSLKYQICGSVRARICVGIIDRY
jgi:CheY-like chemotaxis protein